jgi:hypothetical protein
MGRMQGSEPVVEEAEPGLYASVDQHLSVADGFRFGCGFSLALFGAVFILVMIVAIVLLIAMLVGLPVPNIFTG